MVGSVVAHPAGSLAVDPQREVVLLLEDRTLVDVHRNAAFVKDLRQDVDQKLHCHEQSAVAVEQQAMNRRWAADVQDRQASETVALDPMPALLVETHSARLPVQVGQVAG